MFNDDQLKDHFETSATIKSQSAVVAEWNMNFLDNISRVGNYRYRKFATGTSSKYSSVPNTYDIKDSGNFYTGATDADILIDGGTDVDTDQPIFFTAKKEKESLLFSLEDCFGRFRPRSGINKIRYGITKSLHHSNSEMFRRPRYYMPDKNDKFKYWTSYRTENGVEYGISYPDSTNQSTYHIDDAAPYVVYKEPVPANKIVVKMQTNVGSVDLGPFANSSGIEADPFFGDANKTTPVIWKIQYLDAANNWIDAISFNALSKRKDGSPIVASDGYVEISYGLIIPDQYKDVFVFNYEYASTTLLPEENTDGQAFLIRKNATDAGTYYVWSNGSYKTFEAKYGWYLQDGGLVYGTGVVTQAANVKTHIDPTTKAKKFEEFGYISGLRVVVSTMNNLGSTFDLIELSPRLAVDLSEKTKSYTVTKPASDLGVSGLPVGQLLASTGSLDLFDYDQSFNINNIYTTKNPGGSIIAKYAGKNLQIKIYEIVVGVNDNYVYVPVKAMYADGFPEISNRDRSVSIKLRDLYFMFESMTAPEILIQDVSLSYAISLLFDNIGFTNYVFKRVEGETDQIIPFFYIGQQQSVAEVLQKLAISSQSAMFFDEDNNFVVMSKNYMMPSSTQRPTDITLYGSQDSSKSAVYKNKHTTQALANILDIVSQDNNVYNDGKITYTTRYIQKSYGTIKQAYLLDKQKRWIYKPAMLWEVSGSGNTKSINDETGSQGKFNLAAIPLNSSLSNKVPTVANGTLIDNIIDLGEAVYWMPRYNGYFYANGEIIKFDAIEYNVASVGNVWITSLLDYQKYFSKISFNGKIYPTGRVRIYSEPNYQVISGTTSLVDGAVAKHGRAQFGTVITSHEAGINQYWLNAENVRGCTMKSSYIFDPVATDPTTASGFAGKTTDNSTASTSSRSGVIKNFLSYTYAQESSITSPKIPDSQTVQASAFVFEGPSFKTTEKPQDFVSYVHKSLISTDVTAAKTNKSFKHFGTRLRVIGKIENNDSQIQSASGSTSYFTATPKDSSSTVNISGGGGGLAVLLNPNTNEGYYFEITALSENNLESYEDSDKIKNLVFYKIQKDPTDGLAVPLMLNQVGTKDKWVGGLAQVLIDDGKFTGQSTVISQDENTVYDLAVEYRDVGSVRRFFLYLNNNQIATLDDPKPLPVTNNVAMFVRGSSKLMFENLYALANNYTDNSSVALDTVVSSAFGDTSITANESFRKYAISGMVQSTYLSGISPTNPPKYNIYYEEFGTIMREASYFNIKYDKAFPAIYSKIAPTFNSIRGYTVSGYFGGPYGAEFLVFNNTDTRLNLDETSGNYLRILGLTFTQASNSDLTVDEFFSKKSDFSDQVNTEGNIIDPQEPIRSKQQFYDIKLSRSTYGKNDFNLDAPYIQSQDAANDMMSWIISKIMKPRKSIGIKVFANPMIQLGDIVSIDYTKDGVSQVAKPTDRFIVYNIEYTKSISGPEMTIHVSEVV